MCERCCDIGAISPVPPFDLHRCHIQPHSTLETRFPTDVVGLWFPTAAHCATDLLERPEASSWPGESWFASEPCAVFGSQNGFGSVSLIVSHGFCGRNFSWFLVQMGEIQEKSCHNLTSFRRLGHFFGRQISGALLNDMWQWPEVGIAECLWGWLSSQRSFQPQNHLLILSKVEQQMDS